MDGRLTLIVLLVASLAAGTAVWLEMREEDAERAALDFKTAFTPDRAARLLTSPPLDTEVGRNAVRRALAWDFAFIPFYAFVLWTLIKLVTGPNTRTPVPLPRWTVFLPVGAALLDAVENRGILALLAGATDSWLPPLVSIAGSVAMAIALGLPLYLIVMRLRARRRGEPTTRADPPLDFETVLEAEHRALGLEGRANRVSGLAFSGGGIRSATFNLGVLQALAGLGLLQRFDYLSTVSGGGYIGTWLAQWVRRESQRDDASQAPAIERVAEQLSAEANQEKPEADPVVHLRNYSNYLTPRLGFLSADTWTTIATYSRNLLLNLVIIVSLTGVVLLLPRAVVDWLNFFRDGAFDGTPLAGVRITEGVGIAQLWAGLAAFGLALLAVIGIGINLAGAVSRSARVGDGLTSQAAVLRMVILPLVLSSVIAGYWLARIGNTAPAWLWMAGTAVLYAASWLVSVLVAVVVSSERKLAPWVELGSRMAGWALLVGAAGGYVLYLVNQVVARNLGTAADPVHAWSDWRVVTLCPPIVMTLFTLIAVLHMGLAGRAFDDYLREWLSRAGAWITICSLGWLALTGLAFYGPVLIAELAPLTRGAVASGWLATSIAGAVAGNAQQHGATRRWHPLVLKLAPWVFIVGLIVSVSWGFDNLLSRHHPDRWRAFTTAAAIDEPSAETLEYRRGGLSMSVARGATEIAPRASVTELHDSVLDGQLDQGEFWWWLIGLSLVACGFSGRLAINEFSMHQYYRNRLVRAYPGASNPNRSENPFTGFDPEDDSDLGLEPPPRPFHLVNAALNLVHGRRLGWQERKAASFTFTPLHSGYELPADENELRPDAAFRSSASSDGLTLGTAMAISGAAASPNMGFRSTPALTLLLTVFNVRLGWWLGNPRYGQPWRRGGPVFALRPLLAELFGLTSERSRDVYLSDGGHFENLGIYELVRRRSRFIVACDAGADPDLTFTDLANAIRKCRTDFGVEIDIDVSAIAHHTEGVSRRHCAVGRITYPRRRPDGDDDDLPERGWLLYIKASTTGDEPEDVSQYAVGNPEFPHQSTLDQFFDESQFESYRRLGLHIGRRVFCDMQADTRDNWEAIFKGLYQRWYTPTVPVEASFAQHGRVLVTLFNELGAKPDLAFLAPQIYQEWDGLGDGGSGVPATADERRAGFFYCNSLIQLMENVYLELRLDDEHSSPDNRGWMQLFRRWAGAPMLQATWAISAGTYGSRFQSFCERRLGLSQGAIEFDDLDQPTPAETIRRLAGNVPPEAAREIEDRSSSEKIYWHELQLRAPGMRFPIGFCVLARKPDPERGEVGYVYYLFVDEDLRRSGLAERGLRTLQRELRKRRQQLEISRHPDHRLAAVDDHRWLAFQHFFAGSIDAPNGS